MTLTPRRIGCLCNIVSGLAVVHFSSGQLREIEPLRRFKLTHLISGLPAKAERIAFIVSTSPLPAGLIIARLSRTLAVAT